MSGRPRLVPVLSSSRTTAPFQVRLHFRYWHNPDVQALAFLDRPTAALPTGDQERRFISAFQTRFKGTLKVAV